MGLILSMIESRHNNRPICSYIKVCKNLADITRRNITNVVPFRCVSPFYLRAKLGKRTEQTCLYQRLKLKKLNE